MSCLLNQGDYFDWDRNDPKKTSLVRIDVPYTPYEPPYTQWHRQSSAVVVHAHRPCLGDTRFALRIVREKQWDKLPHLSVLQNDPEFNFLLREPYYLSRNQIRHQFVHRRRHGGPPGAEACTLGDAQIISFVGL